MASPVPHVKHPDIDTLTAAIGVCKDGIDFNALDGQPVHSIFLIISPEQKPEEHLEAMEAVFSHLSQDTFRSFPSPGRIDRGGHDPP